MYISSITLGWFTALLFSSVGFDSYPFEREANPVLFIEVRGIETDIDIRLEELTYEKVYPLSVQVGIYKPILLRPSRPRCRGPPTKSKPRLWRGFFLSKIKVCAIV